MKSSSNIPLKTLVVSIVAALFAAGCAVTPKPVTESEVRDRVQNDQFRIYASQEQILGPITFSNALARSLKYNLDYRLKLMESALNTGLAEVARFDMLPNLLVSAGYTQRNNITGSRSFNIVNGEAIDSNPPSYTGGQEKDRRLASAEFSWSALDFGVGYYRARQAADQYLIAEERRRRVVQNILQDMRSAYWRAVGAQRMARDAEHLLDRVRSALERSRKAEAAGLLPAKEALQYQRMLLDALTLLTARRQELELAKRELAALMNVTPGSSFTLADEAEPPLPQMPVNIAELEELALINRPELRQEDYQTRITAAEARKQLLYLLPNLSLNIGMQYDSNKYLYKSDWIDASTRVTWNLFKALSINAHEAAHEGQVKVDDLRRMALSMAILTQVRVSIERYRLALNDFDIAKESLAVDQRAAAYARAALTSRVDSELELIRTETRAINSEFQRHAAYAAAQNAFGRIYNSVGLEVVPEGLNDATVETIGKRVIEHIQTIENNTFASLMAEAAKPVKFLVKLEPILETNGVTGEATDVAILSNVIQTTLRNNRYELARDDSGHRLQFQLQINPTKNGVRRAQWQIALLNPNGKKLGETTYTSVLAETPSAGSLRAFTEAATLASLRQINAWLNEAVQ